MYLPILKKGQTATGKNRVVHADDETLNLMVARYDPKHHEAPITIGPLMDTKPAYGWVKSLLKEGDILYGSVDIAVESVAEEIRSGRRRVEKAGFYPDMSLRHIILSGNVPFLPGLAAHFTSGSGWITFEFNETNMKGGKENMDLNDPRMKAFLRLGDEIHFGLKPKEFAEGDNPGEILHRKAMDILANPPVMDEYGRRVAKSINYTVAFEMACKQNPALAARYIQQIEDVKYRNMKPTLAR